MSYKPHPDPKRRRLREPGLVPIPPVRVPAATLAAFRELAEQRQVSLSTVLREALEEYLERRKR